MIIRTEQRSQTHCFYWHEHTPTQEEEDTALRSSFIIMNHDSWWLMVMLIVADGDISDDARNHLHMKVRLVVAGTSHTSPLWWDFLKIGCFSFFFLTPSKNFESCWIFSCRWEVWGRLPHRAKPNHWGRKAGSPTLPIKRWVQFCSWISRFHFPFKKF